MDGSGEKTGRSGWLRDHFPLGILQPRKPRHFTAVARTLLDNAGRWHEMWKVLNGPCNGCAVQTDGLRDNVLPRSPHFCLIRLGLIEEALRKPFDPRRVADVSRMRAWSNERVESLGRVSVPLLRERSDGGFRAISFERAYLLAAEWIGAHRGDRSAFFTTSKGICNEEYFAFQQFARVAGFTHNVDSCARQCHAASVSGLKATLGIGAASGSLSDFIHSDLLVLAGTNLANNQPLVMRYIEHGRATRGGRPHVWVVNSFREPGLERYWVPSSPRSAMFGSKIANRFVRVRVGGDVAFFNGVVKVLVEEKRVSDAARRFIDARTTGFDALRTELATQTFEMLEEHSGVPRGVMAETAREMAATPNVLFVWGMGLTQHHHGTNNIKAVVNVALALGQIGRPGAGVFPLRGQSSVQSAGECGVAPTILPGGDAISADNVARLERAWGASLPRAAGLATGPMIEAAHAGKIDCLMGLGGNLLDTLPGRDFVRDALSRVKRRIRFDVMLNKETLIEPDGSLLILPVRNWYEWDSVFTTTSTDRTIRAFGGSIRPRAKDVPESWRAMAEIARRMGVAGYSYTSTQEIRHAMDRDIWMYRGIAALDAPHKQMQWGGPWLYESGFERMPGGRAVFSPLRPANRPIPPDHFQVSTRRGWGQWNSQHRHRSRPRRDSFTAARDRRDVLMHPDDAARLGLRDGQLVTLVADTGRRMNGPCRVDDSQMPRHVQVFWPAANDLIPPGVYDGPSQEPDYNVFARIEAAARIARQSGAE